MIRHLHTLLKKHRFKSSNIIDLNPISHKSRIYNSSLLEEVHIAAHADIRHTTIETLTSIGRYTKITHTEIGKYCAISWDCK